ncbi:cysteine hydrolase family protein [Salinibacterium hongtaonis]|uniref:cysteine hydrolase family protein n=1 Tax=Homoserinimonas hongtaonis TaxID=2079791 RepID=UPI000D388381|nr:isochorismatase family cysteine hydrolase [Salinibacterium hongtaonis]AWB88461.1 cysteine hydrolase [Salinibacterium hongtaonis]
MTALAERRLATLTSATEKPALIVVDVQKSFGSPDYLADYGLTPEALVALDAAVGSIESIVASARSLGVAIVWVELASDPGNRWRASQWLREGDLEAPYSPGEPCVIGTEGAEWFRVAPAEGELRVRKRGYSGFLGTNLAEQLHARGITWVTVVGLTSECCVAATAEDAMQLDWPVVIPADATAAYDLRIHENAVEMLALNVAAIATVDEVVQLWREIEAAQ